VSFFGDLGKAVDSGLEKGQNIAKSGIKKIEGFNKELGSQAEGFYNSFDYDDRAEVMGEAKAIHPNAFLQFTPLKWIGASRLPVLGSRVAKGIYDRRGQIKTGWKKLNKVKGAIPGKNPLPLTTKAIKKFRNKDKAAGILSGTAIASMINSGVGTQTNRGEAGSDWIPARKKKRTEVSRWI